MGKKKSISRGAVGSEVLPTAPGDVLHMEFGATDASAPADGKAHKVVNGRGSILAADIKVGNKTADGGYAIETVFERRKAAPVHTRLREFCSDHAEDFWVRHFVIPG